jgi:hypothetical protein
MINERSSHSAFHEEFFMACSWTVHVRELQYHQRLRMQSSTQSEGQTVQLSSSGTLRKDSHVWQDPSQDGWETFPDMFVQPAPGKIGRKETKANGTEQQKYIDR